MKLQLKKLVGQHRLTHAQFHTIIIEIESILNSRPLLPIHIDLQEGPTVLTWILPYRTSTEILTSESHLSHSFYPTQMMESCQAS